MKQKEYGSYTTKNSSKYKKNYVEPKCDWIIPAFIDSKFVF